MLLIFFASYFYFIELHMASYASNHKFYTLIYFCEWKHAPKII